MVGDVVHHVLDGTDLLRVLVRNVDLEGLLEREDELDQTERVGAQILHELGVRKLRLLTNNPVKYRALHGYGLDIVERVPLEMPWTEKNERYLRTKAEKMGHLLVNF